MIIATIVSVFKGFHEIYEEGSIAEFGKMFYIKIMTNYPTRATVRRTNMEILHIKFETQQNGDSSAENLITQPKYYS